MLLLDSVMGTVFRNIQIIYRPNGRTFGATGRRCYCSQVAVPVTNDEPLTVNEDNQYELLAQSVTPLWKVPYQDQLKLKHTWSREITKQIITKIKLTLKRAHLFRWMHQLKVEPVKPSPVTEAYRNKDEFNIRSGVDGNPKTVGFFVGSAAKGTAVCVRPTHLINMKEKHKQVAEAYEHYVCQSPLRACHDFNSGGHWRSLVVRSNQEGQVMAVVQFHPQNMEPARVAEEAEQLGEYFKHGDGSACQLDSLYFQPCPHTRCTNDQVPFQLLAGAPHLTEKLCGRTFRISPDSFFQVNTVAAEVLYGTALSLAELEPSTTLLDVCCGTGTVSILASELVRGAVGVESVYSAVSDARHNAISNGVTNVEFIPGKVEKKLHRILEELNSTTDIVAVVNPGRSGLHEKAVDVLCASSHVQRVVYISCKADSPNTLSNFVDLCKDGNFTLRRVVPVDMFPHTVHTELILVFER